jgi:hypothetical protein
MEPILPDFCRMQANTAAARQRFHVLKGSVWNIGSAFCTVDSLRFW